MCELQFKEMYFLRRGTVASKGKRPKPKMIRVLNTQADMFYSQWDDEIYINSAFPCDEYDRKYPFHSQMLEDDADAILTHEAIHQALNNTVGWTAAKFFDRICPHWALKYWNNPP